MILFNAQVSINGVTVAGDVEGLTIQAADLDELEFRDLDLTEPVTFTVTRTFDADEWAVLTEHLVISSEPGKL